MANLKNWIDDFLKKNNLTWDDIQKVHLGDIGWNYSQEKEATVLKPEQAKSILDYDFSSGYGGEESHAFHIYLKDWILIKIVYDGSESMVAIPRKPNKSVRPEGYGG